MGKLSDQSGEDWAGIAKIYKELTTGVANKPIRAILTGLNTMSPFSGATGIHDNGCGPGIIIGHLIKEYGGSIPADCTLSASDFSEHMLELARKRKEDEQAADPTSAWNRVEIFMQDATNLEHIASDSKSHLMAGWVYFMTNDPQKCLTESLRVLRQDGVMACSSWQGSQWLEIMNLVTKIRPDLEVPEMPDEWRWVEPLQQKLEKTGFRDVEVREVQVEMAVDEYAPMIDLFSRRMPHMIKLLEQFTEDEMTRLEEIMLQRLKEYCPTVPGRLTGVSLVAFGRK